MDDSLTRNSSSDGSISYVESIENSDSIKENFVHSLKSSPIQTLREVKEEPALKESSLSNGIEGQQNSQPNPNISTDQSDSKPDPVREVEDDQQNTRFHPDISPDNQDQVNARLGVGISTDQINTKLQPDISTDNQDQTNVRLQAELSSTGVNEVHHNAYFYLDSSVSDSEAELSFNAEKDQPNDLPVVSNEENDNMSLKVNTSIGDSEHEVDPATGVNEDQHNNMLPLEISNEESNNESPEAAVNVKIELHHDGYQADISTAESDTEASLMTTSKVIVPNYEFKIPNSHQGSKPSPNDHSIEDCAMRYFL